MLLVLTIGILIGILTIYQKKRKLGNTDNQSTNLHGNLNGPSLILYSHIIVIFILHLIITVTDVPNFELHNANETMPPLYDAPLHYQNLHSIENVNMRQSPAYDIVKKTRQY